MRHVVVFRWIDGTTEADIASVEAGLRDLPGLVPEIRNYHHGADLGRGQGNWDFGLVAEFDSVEDWATYRDHPAHQAVIADRIRPILAERVAVQIPR